MHFVPDNEAIRAVSTVVGSVPYQVQVFLHGVNLIYSSTTIRPRAAASRLSTKLGERRGEGEAEPEALPTSHCSSFNQSKIWFVQRRLPQVMMNGAVEEAVLGTLHILHVWLWTAMAEGPRRWEGGVAEWSEGPTARWKMRQVYLCAAFFDCEASG